jgi:hypothetical protein
MGGRGSGRHWADVKRTVDSSWTLKAEYFSRLHRDDPDSPDGTLIWKSGFGIKFESRYGLEINSYELSDSRVRLWYLAEGVQGFFNCNIPLTSTIPNYGGLRWWFLCPMSKDGVLCNRRTSRLYLPSGEKYFGCRQCHDLTYMSCQDSHKNTIFSELARETGMTQRQVRRSILQGLGIWSRFKITV